MVGGSQGYVSQGEFAAILWVSDLRNNFRRRDAEADGVPDRALYLGSSGMSDFAFALQANTVMTELVLTDNRLCDAGAAGAPAGAAAE